MSALISFVLAVIQGSVMATVHFAVLCYTESWAMATEQLAYLVSSYSLMIYLLILAWSTYRYVSVLPATGLWLVWVSSVLHQYLHIADYGIVTAIQTLAPWISTLWSSAWYSISRCSLIAWAVNFRPSMFLQLWNRAASFFAQPHVVHLIEQTSAIVLGIWVLVTHIMNSDRESRCNQEVNNNNNCNNNYDDDDYGDDDDEDYEDIPLPSVYGDGRRRQHAYYGSDEETHIYWILREIITNCDAHWQNYFDQGCKLESGASRNQVEGIEALVCTVLPRDFQVFLRLTNGLKNVLDGTSELSITFKSTHSDDWMRHAELVLDNERQALWTKYLVESMFGPGTHDELLEQTKPRYVPHNLMNFVHVASSDDGTSGVYLVPPMDFCTVVQFWLPIAHDHDARNGSIIGRIQSHEEAYFGKHYRDLEPLTNHEGWLLLQVQEVQGRNYCRLYPSFTAYLQTLAELTRRRSQDVIMPNIPESFFAESCRGKWESEWARRRLHDQYE